MKLHLKPRNHFCTVERWSHPRPSCPEKLWSLHPWRHPKPDWKSSWATGSRYPCL